MASEEMIFYIFFRKFSPFGCHGNQANSVVWTKIICLVEDNSINNSETFCQNICNKIALNANFHFSHYKSMETLSKLP